MLIGEMGGPNCYGFAELHLFVSEHGLGLHLLSSMHTLRPPLLTRQHHLGDFWPKAVLRLCELTYVRTVSRAGTLTLGRLKLLCERLFGLPAARQALSAAAGGGAARPLDGAPDRDLAFLGLQACPRSRDSAVSALPTPQHQHNVKITSTCALPSSMYAYPQEHAMRRQSNACMRKLTCVARLSQNASTRLLLGVVSSLQGPLKMSFDCWQAGAEVTVSERDVGAARSAEAAQRLAAAADHEQRMLRQLQVTQF